MSRTHNKTLFGSENTQTGLQTSRFGDKAYTEIRREAKRLVCGLSCVCSGKGVLL